MSDPDQDLDAFTQELISHLAEPISARREAEMERWGGRLPSVIDSVLMAAKDRGEIIDGYAVRWPDGKTFVEDQGVVPTIRQAQRAVGYLEQRWPGKGPWSIVPVRIAVGAPIDPDVVEATAAAERELARREQEILRERAQREGWPVISTSSDD